MSEVYQKTGEPRYNVIAVAVPIKDEKQEIAGILVLQTQLDTLFEWTRGIEVGPSGFVQQPMRTAFAARIDSIGGVLLVYGIIFVLICLLAYLTLHELTVTKRAQEKIKKLNNDLERRAMELEAANKELEAFSYSVSHDLRAPLRSIDGFSQALLEDYGNRLDEQGKDFLNRLCAASRHMSELIDDMLHLSRVTRGEMTYKAVDLSSLARAIAAELRKTQPDRRVQFVIADGLTTTGDPRLLRVALENLLGNAWKFTGKRPDAKIEFDVERQEGQPAFFVRDNGAGFDVAYADKLFGPFQRLHARSEFPGTGIGLATVERIVHRHSGRIWAEGEVGKGATFYFTLGEAAVQKSSAISSGNAKLLSG